MALNKEVLNIFRYLELRRKMIKPLEHLLNKLMYNRKMIDGANGGKKITMQEMKMNRFDYSFFMEGVLSNNDIEKHVMPVHGDLFYSESQPFYSVYLKNKPLGDIHDFVKETIISKHAKAIEGGVKLSCNILHTLYHGRRRNKHYIDLELGSKLGEFGGKTILKHVSYRATISFILKRETKPNHALTA